MGDHRCSGWRRSTELYVLIAVIFNAFFVLAPGEILCGSNAQQLVMVVSLPLQTDGLAPWHSPCGSDEQPCFELEADETMTLTLAKITPVVGGAPVIVAGDLTNTPRFDLEARCLAHISAQQRCSENEVVWLRSFYRNPISDRFKVELPLCSDGNFGRLEMRGDLVIDGLGVCPKSIAYTIHTTKEPQPSKPENRFANQMRVVPSCSSSSDEMEERIKCELQQWLHETTSGSPTAVSELAELLRVRTLNGVPPLATGFVTAAQGSKTNAVVELKPLVECEQTFGAVVCRCIEQQLTASPPPALDSHPSARDLILYALAGDGPFYDLSADATGDPRCKESMLEKDEYGNPRKLCNWSFEPDGWNDGCLSGYGQAWLKVHNNNAFDDLARKLSKSVSNP